MVGWSLHGLEFLGFRVEGLGFRVRAGRGKPTRSPTSFCSSFDCRAPWPPMTLTRLDAYAKTHPFLFLRVQVAV